MADTDTDPRQNKLQVWHVRNPPSTTFFAAVPSVEAAVLVMNALADYDLFLGEAIVGSNAQGLEVFLDGEWVEFYDSEGRCVDDLREKIAG